jgi:putative Mg2+ transporter-C (MgtC) family protein
METEYPVILLRLLLAVLAGGLIGFERNYHGRPAGFRTHTLVCVASSVLMLVTVYEWVLSANAPIDPTRMAQGIMTGIGFLGAGVIIKEGLSVRGLTTAASIWITAAIGILIGVGFYFTAVAATAVTLGVLVLFRWIEAITPALHYGRLHVRFSRQNVLAQEDLLKIIDTHGISQANLTYQLGEQGKTFEYRMTIRTHEQANYKKLAETLIRMENIIEFHIMPTGD